MQRVGLGAHRHDQQTTSMRRGSSRSADQAIRGKARSEALIQPGWERFGTVRARCDLPDSSQPAVKEEPMSNPDLSRPDVYPIRASAEQAGFGDNRGQGTEEGR